MHIWACLGIIFLTKNALQIEGIAITYMTGGCGGILLVDVALDTSVL